MSMAERKRKMDSTKVAPKYEEEMDKVDMVEEEGSDVRNWGGRENDKKEVRQL